MLSIPKAYVGKKEEAMEKYTWKLVQSSVRVQGGTGEHFHEGPIKPLFKG